MHTLQSYSSKVSLVECPQHAVICKKSSLSPKKKARQKVHFCPKHGPCLGGGQGDMSPPCFGGWGTKGTLSPPCFDGQDMLLSA